MLLYSKSSGILVLHCRQESWILELYQKSLREAFRSSIIDDVEHCVIRNTNCELFCQTSLREHTAYFPFSGFSIMLLLTSSLGA